MSLPWFRMDSHIGSHDKVLSLLSDPSPKRWQAFTSYVCAIGWAADHGTDGRVMPAALPFVHGTLPTARLLVIHRLWCEAQTGWEIVNFAERQQLDVVTAGKKAAARTASEKANCMRWHKQPCWTGTECPIISGSDSDADSGSDPLRPIRSDSYVRTYVRTDGEGQDVALSGSFAERATREARSSNERSRR